MVNSSVRVGGLMYSDSGEKMFNVQLNKEAIPYSIHYQVFISSVRWPSWFTQSHLDFNENINLNLGDKKLSA